MKIKIINLLIVLLMSNLGYAQTIGDYLEEIEENNIQLKAAREKKKQGNLEARTGIYPKPLSVNYGYFPDNNTVVDEKQTFNVTQSFYMPGVYKKMKSVAETQGDVATLDYETERKKVLYEAQKVMIRLVFKNKMIQRLQKRLNFAEQRRNALKKQVEAGDANALELNKAKFHLLRMSKQLSEQKRSWEKLMEQLNKLNGGEELEFENPEYPVFANISRDSLLDEKKDALPSIKKASKMREQSESVVELQRSMNFPELKFGYGSETVGNSSFKGMLVGISIPLWSNKNKVKAAKAQSQYAELEYKNRLLNLRSETEKQYKSYLSLKENLEEYKETLENTNNIELLKKSLKLGKISIIDYYREVQYYYSIYNEYLELEREYYLALARMYQYRL